MKSLQLLLGILYIGGLIQRINSDYKLMTIIIGVLFFIVSIINIYQEEKQ